MSRLKTRTWWRVFIIPAVLLPFLRQPLPAADTDDYSTYADRNLTDRQIKREIRRAIWHDRSTIVYWSKVKVTAKEGQVILQGTVRSNIDREDIGEKAADVAGSENVTNDLTVKGS